MGVMTYNKIMRENKSSQSDYLMFIRVREIYRRQGILQVEKREEMKREGRVVLLPIPMTGIGWLNIREWEDITG